MRKRLGIGILLTSAVFAQTPAPATSVLHYEVVSIHESKADPNADTTDYQGYLHNSHVDIRGFSDLNLLVSAFGMDYFRIELPKGLPFATYDLHLSSAPETDAALMTLSDEQAKQAHELMLQEVLLDRFHLRYHFIERNMKVHMLTVGEGGKLRASAVPTSSDQMETSEGPSTEPPLDWQCSSFHCALHARGYSLDWLADRLSVTLHAPVFNRTGLKGLWDLNLRWELQTSSTANIADDSYPPLNIALSQQLGLRLGETKAPLPVLVVDHIEEPSAN